MSKLVVGSISAFVSSLLMNAAIADCPDTISGEEYVQLRDGHVVHGYKYKSIENDFVIQPGKVLHLHSRVPVNPTECTYYYEEHTSVPSAGFVIEKDVTDTTVDTDVVREDGNVVVEKRVERHY